MQLIAGGQVSGGTGAAMIRAGPEMVLERQGEPAIVLKAVNSSMWEAMFAIGEDIQPGTYKVAVRHQFQGDWSNMSFFQPGNPAFKVARTVQIAAAPTPPSHTIQVADYFARYGIPARGLNYSSGAPVNGTAAILHALHDAAAFGDGVQKIVQLPVGKLFVDGALSIPPKTTLRGAKQELSTLYFLEDGIGRQVGGMFLVCYDDVCAAPF
jgi:hypothetical protein